MTLTAVTPLAGRARCVWRAWNCETHRMTLIALSFVFAISPTPYFTSSIQLSMTHLDCVDVLFLFRLSACTALESRFTDTSFY